MLSAAETETKLTNSTECTAVDAAPLLCRHCCCCSDFLGLKNNKILFDGTDHGGGRLAFGYLEMIMMESVRKFDIW